MGIRRERAPFVFTPAMAAVLDGRGSELFERFVEVCCKAFNVLRQNCTLLCSLLSLMIPCGIPELSRYTRAAKWRNA
jgi:phosphatidylinositol kinase/protein kinase (PI-3  family)